MHNTDVLEVALAVALAKPATSPTAVPLRTPSAAESRSAALGLAINLPPTAPLADKRAALEEARRAGVTLFALDIDWATAERRPGRFDLAELTRTARLLRQSGTVLHLDVPLVDGLARRVPADLAALAFDDPKLSVRLGRFFDALGPALLDFSTLSLGNEADSYFADSPEELEAFSRLVGGAVEFLRKRAPRLLVGVVTAAPTESRAPEVADALHEPGGALFYVYSPFERNAPFRHRPPASIDRDWAAVLARARGRPVAFTEVSFSSSPENASSPARQADFVRRMRRWLAKTPREKILFARYVPWRDPVPPARGPRPTPAPPPPAGAAGRREAFFANRGLQTARGRPKPAWREFAAAADAPNTRRP